MKIRVRELRRLIAETMNQMKLSVASSNPPAMAYGDEEEDDLLEPDVVRPFLATEPGPNFEPDEETKDLWRQHIQHQAKAGFSEPWEVEPPPWDEEHDPFAPSGVRKKI